jgi:hypothetical protein
MSHPDGPGARREREPDKECAAPTGIGDGADISLQGPCDPSTSRVAFVEHEIRAVNPGVAERLAGTVIWFPHRASISGAGHRLLATRYLRQQPDSAADGSKVFDHWMRLMHRRMSRAEP